LNSSNIACLLIHSNLMQFSGVAINSLTDES